MSFHVPNQYRLRTGVMASDNWAGNNGAFYISRSKDSALVVVASDGMGWEHTSVRHQYKRFSATPTWDEMCFIKDLFWDPDDVVMQLHPAESEYVNYHPNVLHLWRPTGAQIPTPPSELVGPILKGRK